MMPTSRTDASITLYRAVVLIPGFNLPDGKILASGNVTVSGRKADLTAFTTRSAA